MKHVQSDATMWDRDRGRKHSKENLFRVVEKQVIDAYGNQRHMFGNLKEEGMQGSNQRRTKLIWF